MDLRGKTIIITGASRGIGAGLADRLADEGANLVFIVRDPASLDQFTVKHGKNHHSYIADLSNMQSVMDAAKHIAHDFTSIDILIHSAGIGVYKKFPDVSLDDWERSYAIDVTAPYFLTQTLLPLLQKADKSCVMTIGSGMGTIPTRGRSVYCSSKFAVRGWMLSLADEYEAQSPQFCLITLGSVITSFGTKTIEEKTKEFENGRAYFTVPWVSDKLTEILKDESRANEIVLYPGDYGQGTWTKP
jgi:short-subunit dehydrogenase